MKQELTLNEWRDAIHANAVAHGWWDDGERNFGEIIALCHSELSEALEADRESMPMVCCPCYEGCEGDEEADCLKCLEAHPNIKPDGAAFELVDCIIRILDWCGQYNIDVDKLMQLKHVYNIGRPHKHGKRY